MSEEAMDSVDQSSQELRQVLVEVEVDNIGSKLIVLHIRDRFCGTAAARWYCICICRSGVGSFGLSELASCCVSVGPHG